MELSLKPSHAKVKDYYNALNQFGQLNISHETAVRQAFASLLDTCARQFKWKLVQEYRLPAPKNKSVIVDGAVLDSFTLKHGFWEAKDLQDSLEKEVKKKLEQGYPRNNIIICCRPIGFFLSKEFAMDPRNIEYAKHLFDEWKYRHEMFFKLLFRYSWIYVVAAVLPSLAAESPIGAGFFQQVRSGSRTSAVYWGFVVVFFIASHFHLVFEYRRTEAIRNKLRALRAESKEDEKIAFREFARKLPHEVVYLSAFIIFFILCWHYQHGQSTQPKSNPAAKSVCVPVCEPSVDSRRPAESERR